MGTRIAGTMRLAAVEEYMPRIGDDELKRIVKEAIKEWMTDQFAAFGRWSFLGIAAAGLGLLGLAILSANGWHK